MSYISDILVAKVKFKILIASFRRSEFIKHVGVLAKGSVLAQLITLLAAPIISRIYNPESFAIYAIFTSIFSLVLPAASARYELALVVINNKKDSDNLLALAVWVSGIISSLVFFVFIFWEIQLKNLMTASLLGNWWFLVPLALFLASNLNTLRCFANRHKHYKIIGYGLIFQALIFVTCSILFGLIGFVVHGLLVSILLSTFVGCLFLFFVYREKLDHIIWFPNKNFLKLFIKYKEFPIHSTIPALLDSLTLMLPIFFLSKNFPVFIVGYYSLLLRVAAGPLDFIARAVSQVHLKKISEDLFKKQNSLIYLKRLTIILISIASLPTIVFMLFGPEIFAFAFGSQWEPAGRLLSILIPSLSLKFVVSTLSGALIATRHNKLAALWQIIAFIVTLYIFLVYSSKLEVEHFFILMTVTDIFLYIIYYFLIWFAVKNPRKMSY